jgi:Cytoplasmic tRNA 2-thiolation protein 2
LLIESFFDRLQDKYNVNTVPTVVKLTNKLSKAVNLGGMTPYPFCPLCLGVRDQITNLLEMGSTIKSVDPVTGAIISIQRPEEWLEGGGEALGRVLCFGCKRMIISANKNRGKLVSLIPPVVLENASRAAKCEDPSITQPL